MARRVAAGRGRRRLVRQFCDDTHDSDRSHYGYNNLGRCTATRVFIAHQKARSV